MIDSILWAVLSETFMGLWLVFSPKLPAKLRQHRRICLLSLLSVIICWFIAIKFTGNPSLENLFGIVGWLSLIVFIISVFILGYKCDKSKTPESNTEVNK